MGFVAKGSDEKFCDRCGVVEDESDTVRDGSVYEAIGAGIKRDLCAECLASWRRKEFPLYIVETPSSPQDLHAHKVTADLGSLLRAPDGTPICSVDGCPNAVTKWIVQDVLGFCSGCGFENLT